MRAVRASPQRRPSGICSCFAPRAARPGAPPAARGGCRMRSPPVWRRSSQPLCGTSPCSHVRSSHALQTITAFAKLPPQGILHKHAWLKSPVAVQRCRSCSLLEVRRRAAWLTAPSSPLAPVRHSNSGSGPSPTGSWSTACSLACSRPQPPFTRLVEWRCRAPLSGDGRSRCAGVSRRRLACGRPVHSDACFHGRGLDRRRVR